MKIDWSEEKNEILKRERGVSFEMAVTEIVEGRVLALLPHPSRPSQKILVIVLKDYAYAVPFVKMDDGNIFLKTLYPSRNFQKLYGGKDETQF